MGRVLLIASAAALCFGCGGSDKSSKSALSYGDNAQRAYERALEQFRQDDCLEAEPMFRKVRREYPFSRFAALSELRIADCLLKQKKYAEAVQAYQQFVRFRPTHEQVPYARFKVAQAHYQQIPSGWFLAPPAHERDQGSARDALKQLRRFLLDFPDDARTAEARKMMTRVVTILARHELYVAKFYLDEGAPKAAVGRLRTLLGAYEGSTIDAEAMLLLGETYLELRDRDEARRTFQALTSRFPKSDEAKAARRHLRRLGPGAG